MTDCKLKYTVHKEAITWYLTNLLRRAITLNIIVYKQWASIFYYRPWTSNGKPAIKRLTSRLLFKHLHVNDRWFNWGDKWTSLNCLLDCYNSKCYELIMSLTSRNPLRLPGVRGLIGQLQSLHKYVYYSWNSGSYAGHIPDGMTSSWCMGSPAVWLAQSFTCHNSTISNHIDANDFAVLGGKLWFWNVKLLW